MSKEAKQRHWDKKYAEADVIKCACGCGESLKSVDRYGRVATYINGHNQRKYTGTDSTKWAAQKRYRARHPKELRDYKRNYYRKRKLLAMELVGNKCSFCGIKYNGTNAPIFEFHHPDPSTKERGITRMLINKAWAKTLKELEKCVLTCANCHNQHHGGEW